MFLEEGEDKTETDALAPKSRQGFKKLVGLLFALNLSFEDQFVWKIVTIGMGHIFEDAANQVQYWLHCSIKMYNS